MISRVTRMGSYRRVTECFLIGLQLGLVFGRDSGRRGSTWFRRITGLQRMTNWAPASGCPLACSQLFFFCHPMRIAAGANYPGLRCGRLVS